MHILVIGASHGIGLEVVRYALARGHSVRAFARGAQSIQIDHPNLEKRTGDATRSDDVKAALEHVEAAVLTPSRASAPATATRASVRRNASRSRLSWAAPMPTRIARSG